MNFKISHLISLLLLIVISTTTVSAKNTGSSFFKYDAAKNWWWYQDINKTKVPVKLSPKEALKMEKETKTIALLQNMINEQRETKAINIKILERLEYAFPKTTPEMYVDKNGKPCVANSSAGCFVMPVIAEGQRVPVIKDWLRNPSPKNSKKYLKWMARYMKQISDVSNGSRFAFLKDGSEAYPTNTDFSYGDNLFFSKSEKVRKAREGEILVKLKDKLAILLFVGENTFFEKVVGTYKNFYQYEGTFLEEMPFVVVFPSKEAEDKFRAYVVNEVKVSGDKRVEKFIKHATFAVRPDLYKKYKIRVTPSVVAFYTGKDEKTKKDKKMFQTILSGNTNIGAIRTSLMDFLNYNGIISSKEIAADKSWAITEDKTKLNSDLKSIKVEKPRDFKKEEETIKNNTGDK